MGAYASLLQRLGHQPWFARLGRAMVPVDRALSRVTRGRVGSMGPVVLPELVLTTTGRTSGLPREQPLLYATDGDALVVAASNWGQPHHPAWSGNLIAQPSALVRLKGEEFPVTARLLSGDERARAWAVMTQVWPAYDTYAERSGREIRVFRLERAR